MFIPSRPGPVRHDTRQPTNTKRLQATGYTPARFPAFHSAYVILALAAKAFLSASRSAATLSGAAAAAAVAKYCSMASRCCS